MSAPEDRFAPNRKYFTMVFEGDLFSFDKNPFQTDTPFGRPIVAAFGNAFEQLDEALNRNEGDCVAPLKSFTAEEREAAIDAVCPPRVDLFYKSRACCAEDKLPYVPAPHAAKDGLSGAVISDTAYEFVRNIYVETGGVTPALRKAYETYLQSGVSKDPSNPVTAEELDAAFMKGVKIIGDISPITDAEIDDILASTRTVTSNDIAEHARLIRGVIPRLIAALRQSRAESDARVMAAYEDAAKIADNAMVAWGNGHGYSAAQNIANAIRARSTAKEGE